jgi:hypothetical protein
VPCAAKAQVDVLCRLSYMASKAKGSVARDGTVSSTASVAVRCAC